MPTHLVAGADAILDIARFFKTDFKRLAVQSALKVAIFESSKCLVEILQDFEQAGCAGQPDKTICPPL